MCSPTFSGNDGPNSVLVSEANSLPDSRLNDTSSLLYSSRILVPQSVVHCEEALPMKVKAAFLRLPCPPLRAQLLLLTLSSKSLSCPTACIQKQCLILERERGVSGLQVL